MVDPFMLLVAASMAAIAILTVVWAVDLFWIVLMRGGVALTFGLILYVAGLGAFIGTGRLMISSVIGFVVAVLIVRPGVDLAYWLYDLSRLGVALQWPVGWLARSGRRPRVTVHWPIPVWLVETREENQIRLADGLEPLWGYFRERMRLRQEIEYRAEREPDDS